MIEKLAISNLLGSLLDSSADLGVCEMRSLATYVLV
jgi:hypothetical protein